MGGKGSVLVTGGAKRIGKAICETLEARGWTVLVHSRAAGNPLCADFSDTAAADSLFAAAAALAPDLRAIVNNAAVFSTADDLPPREAERMRRINLDAPRRLTELLGGRLRGRGGRGAVVNLLDDRIFRAHSGASPYFATKMALWDETRSAAVREAPVLRVNAVAPGPALPPSDAAQHEKGGPVLLDRRPSPEDVAGAVAFLLDAEAVTGQVISVDAGQSLL